MGIQLRPLASTDVLRLHELTPTLLLPIEQGVIEVRTDTETWLVDRASWLLLPAMTPFQARAKSPSAGLLLLGLHPELRQSTVALHEAYLNASQLERFLTTPRLLARTTWMHEICHRYLFERSVCGAHAGLAARFLEAEITKEVYFHCLDRERTRERASMIRSRDALVEKALAHMEAHLFEPISMPELARECSTSPSTLQRAFHRELGAPPAAYLRQRRLQESMLLLKSGRYGVGEVGALVGYDSLSAFSHAFRARFGLSPSEVRRRALQGVAPA